MKIFRSATELRPASPSVVTIGNFDGVHRGHAAILRTVREHAARLGFCSIGVTFDPHPLRQIAPERAPLALMTLTERIERIAEWDLDFLLVQPFNAAFSRLSPEAFIETYLVEQLKARIVCVGENFRFGHGHRGDLETLRAWRNRFDVVEVPPVLFRGGAISSSRIRVALSDGQVGPARRMLGRCYEITGRIVSGEGRGRRLTAPTLNLETASEIVPRDGVYVTTIALDGGPYAGAVTNVGQRPTFGGGGRTIETHLLNGSPPSSVRSARLRFLKRLRDERAFPGPEALREQIARDVATARGFLRRMDVACRPDAAPKRGERSPGLEIR